MKKWLPYILLVIGLWLPGLNLFAQTTQTIFYSVKDGLPSNALYRTVIEKKGFLWIVTEIGLKPFDGNPFRNYKSSDRVDYK